MILDCIKEHAINDSDGNRFTSSFVTLLQESRTLNAKTRKQKALIAEAKIVLDKLYLDRQNLNYQSQYLRKEIAKCEQQETIYQDVDIYPIEEFEQVAPENYKSAANDHELMINRLNFELEERKRMVELAARAKERKILMGLKLKKRSTMIDAFESDLQKILQSTTELQEKLALPNSKDQI